MEEQTKLKEKKSEKRHAQEAEKMRKARILLRKVDCILKSKGIETALKSLMKARLQMPDNSTVCKWFEAYRDMLDAWQYRMMPDVVAEFQKFGFRRARTIASGYVVTGKNRNKLHFYTMCQRTLDEMAERSRLAITDQEGEMTETPPTEVSLNEINQAQIEQGTKI
ncbi:MAG: hypothetical protein A2Y10_08695 [Planctomycetes bacterium GWF2_41_51]|nr:MAG: hypothetical protein A2Y10_08695 [Planctomycetes bacterium GWF2_41_51]HBG28367.1 hypothetical protein [Phycisphaerales bacterium]